MGDMPSTADTTVPKASSKMIQPTPGLFLCSNQLIVCYYGTHVGRIFISDVEFEEEGMKQLVWGDVVVMEKTADVVKSVTEGVLGYFSNPESSPNFGDSPPLSILSLCQTISGKVYHG